VARSSGAHLCLPLTVARYVVLIDSRAEVEARHAYLWYFERNTRAAAGFQREFDAATSSLEQSAHSFPEVEHGIRRRVLRRYPYALLFRIVGDQVQIAAVMHLKREPGYWKRDK
jgi:plasmid stabilization system protein ParE